MKNIFLSLLLSFPVIACFAQLPSSGNKNGLGKQMNVGHFYGRVVDAASNKGIEFASVQLTMNRMDSVTHKMKEEIIAGQLTSGNGDFSLENLPVFGQFSLAITALGYTTYQQKISFNLKMGQGSPQQMLNMVDKDLGNIGLHPNAISLNEVTITDEKPVYELKIDKKVYNVTKDQVATGGTAEDVLKNVPSVNVDIDGNVTMRNSSPQIFVDGRPTTFSIDQIPADAIESVEVITNPSAKYDASGGGGGILNIVLKKNRKMGYNGGVRLGVDSRGRMNLGGDLNTRENKINVFLSGMLNQRRSNVTGQTERSYISGEPTINLFQRDNSSNKGFFGFARGGFDWFFDNRNTLSFNGSYNRGSFDQTGSNTIETDTIGQNGSGTSSTSYTRTTETSRNFENIGGGISYKHIYPKDGREWTADGNYNRSNSGNGGDFLTEYYDVNGNSFGNPVRQQQDGKGWVEFSTVQTDYVNPLSDKLKIETGARGTLRRYSSSVQNFIFVDSLNDYQLVPANVSSYQYTDQVYAGYLTLSSQIKKFGAKIGLRGESSFYAGEIKDNHLRFEHIYPVSLFPSAFFSYKINDKNDLQLNYSRRINRPTFFQILPYTDYTDSLNLSRGNADLNPEFVNSMELSWQKTFDRKNTLLTSIYFKNTEALITNYQSFEFDSVLMRKVIISTYENANSSYAYGGEITAQNSFTKWFNLSVNVNAYNSFINGTNLASNLKNQQFSWFTKVNSTFKLPKNFTLQITGDYRSKTALQVSGNSSGRAFGGGGGGGYFGGTTSTAQGYVKPNYGVDASLKFEFMKNKAASLTLSVSDIFKTKVNETYSATEFFTQTTIRRRDPQIVRLNFSYRFGKFDVSLLKRKNTNINYDMPDMQGM